MQAIVKDHPIGMVYSIRRDWPELAGIVNKELSAITDAERSSILKNYIVDIHANSKIGIGMSDSEKAQVETRPTVNVNLWDFPPFSMIEKNREPAGITVDCLDLISKRTGIEFGFGEALSPML